MTILVGYLPTPQGEAALDAAIAEAALRDTDLVVVNSPRRGATVDADLVGDDASTVLVERASARGVTARVDHALHEDLADTLHSLVQETGADLVVIGLRHRSPVGKLLMGSDAQKILLSAEVPVLAVKAPR